MEDGIQQEAEWKMVFNKKQNGRWCTIFIFI